MNEFYNLLKYKSNESVIEIYHEGLTHKCFLNPYIQYYITLINQLCGSNDITSNLAYYQNCLFLIKATDFLNLFLD